MIFDLSVVTDTLKNLVTTEWPNAPLWTAATPQFAIDVTGLSPDAARSQQGAQLSLYLYHIDENNTQENLFWTAQSQTAGGPSVRYQPLALDLYYLLSAYAQGNYIQEQQAMSVAMRVFHENPIIRGTDGSGQPWELTMSLERRSYDELSRLWQATTSALRLSAVYRAAVVLIEPEPGPIPGPPVAVVDLEVEPITAAGTPQLLSTQRDVRYQAPGATVTFVQDPATVAAGGTIVLIGESLTSAPAARLILTGPYPAITETDVTAWLAPAPDSATRWTVTLPAASGTPPGAAPAPGRYSLRLQAPPAGSRPFRTADVPIGIAAGITAAGGPILPQAARYVVAGTGFTPNATEVLLGTIPLQSAAAARPGRGQFTINPGGTTLTLAPPASLPIGRIYQIRVRVAGVESDPALWLQS